VFSPSYRCGLKLLNGFRDHGSMAFVLINWSVDIVSYLTWSQMFVLFEEDLFTYVGQDSRIAGQFVLELKNTYFHQNTCFQRLLGVPIGN